MNKMTLEDIDVKGKKVLVRVDFNVPIDKKTGKVEDDTRIVDSMETINYLADKGAKVILCSHLGRPDGKFDPQYSLEPAAKRLAELTKAKVIMAKDVTGPDAREKTENMQPGEIVLLENVRFDEREEKNDRTFSKELASLADLYVNDAFGTAHRAHASTVGVADYLPNAVGFLIQKEIGIMSKALDAPDRPFVAVLGGAKVKDKLGVILNLLAKVDTLIIGGGMAFTFLKAKGYEIGDSLLDEQRVDYAKQIIEKATSIGVKLMLPVDVVVADRFAPDAQYKTVKAESIPSGWQSMDIGPKTRKAFASVIQKAKTVLWNGPMGVFEFDNFAQGTNAIAKAMAKCKGTTIVGGGDSVSAVDKSGYSKKMSHISTGGGASLEFLEGKQLPSVAAINDKTRRRVIAGNWKMNTTPVTAKALMEQLKPLVKDSKTEVIVCPPFICIPEVRKAADGSLIKIGAQNMYFEKSGAFTGEVSPEMLKSAGVEYVILGHSERRHYFGETDELINKKVKNAIAFGLKPIICVGETLNQREQKKTDIVIKSQVNSALAGLDIADVKKVIIAYEPIWAIGTGKNATPEEANRVIGLIRETVREKFGFIADIIRIQYGGSMNASNVKEILKQQEIDGGLIGGASLKAEDFAFIVNA